MIVLGPGCFYTSILAPLLTDGILDAISNSKAQKVWVANMSNFPDGHCDGWKISDYLEAFERFCGADFFDHIIVHDADVPDGYESVQCDITNDRVIRDNYLSDLEKNTDNDIYMTISRNKVYHDASKVVSSLLELLS